MPSVCWPTSEALPTASANDPAAAEPDAEVSFVTRDLAPILPKATIAATIPIDEVLMRVRDASNWRGNSGVRYTMAECETAGPTSSIKMAYAAEGSVDPYAGFEARIVPENVTLLSKTSEQLTGGNPLGERVHLVKERRHYRLGAAGPGRDTGRSPGDRKHARTSRPRRRTKGRPEVACPDGARGPRPATVTLPRDRGQHFHD